MNRNEIKPLLGCFGKITFRVAGERCEVHGYIQEVDKKYILFECCEEVCRLIKISDIEDFEPKEMPCQN